MSLNNPLVSVVMSVYNGQKFLNEAIECILHQTYKDLEFIIINDGSSDSSSSIIRKYASLDDRILFINHNNKGLTKSLAIGCQLAKGEYIARQDVDDYSMLSRLQEQVDYLEKHKKVSLIGTWYEVFGCNQGANIYQPIDSDYLLRKDLFSRNPFCHSSTMFRNVSYQNADGYNAKYRVAQDLDLWFSIARIGNLGMVEKVLVKRRVHGDAISQSNLAWIQVFNSFKIRISNIHKIGSVKNLFLFLFSTSYHIMMTLFPKSISNKLFLTVKFFRNISK